MFQPFAPAPHAGSVGHPILPRRSARAEVPVNCAKNAKNAKNAPRRQEEGLLPFLAALASWRSWREEPVEEGEHHHVPRTFAFSASALAIRSSAHSGSGLWPEVTKPVAG